MGFFCYDKSSIYESIQVKSIYLLSSSKEVGSKILGNGVMHCTELIVGASKEYVNIFSQLTSSLPLFGFDSKPRS